MTNTNKNTIQFNSKQYNTTQHKTVINRNEDDIKQNSPTVIFSLLIFFVLLKDSNHSITFVR